GACVNWWLGRELLRFGQHRWFPVNEAQLQRAGERFRRYGVWSLLFSWLPVVGDPLTLVAGVLRVRFLPMLFLVGVGKGARYGVLLWLMQQWS
ncbi:MAG TPA: VTT domain-containing protein, partial [Cellvibrionaceae bacterium]